MTCTPLDMVSATMTTSTEHIDYVIQAFALPKLNQLILESSHTLNMLEYLIVNSPPSRPDIRETLTGVFVEYENMVQQWENVRSIIRKQDVTTTRRDIFLYLETMQDQYTRVYTMDMKLVDILESLSVNHVSLTYEVK